MAKPTTYLSGLFFTLAVKGGGGIEGKLNKNNKSGGACCSTHYWQIRCVCVCVCVCVYIPPEQQEMNSKGRCFV